MPLIKESRETLEKLLAEQAPVAVASQPRTAGKNPRAIRRDGFVPATVYGKTQSPESFQVPAKDFSTIYKKGQRVFTLEHLGGLKVVAKQIGYHTLSFELENVEFQVI